MSFFVAYFKNKSNEFIILLRNKTLNYLNDYKKSDVENFVLGKLENSIADIKS